MLPVSPGDYGLLLIHITAHIDTGTAVIKYAVWDSISPSLKDTLTYIFTVNNITGIKDNETKTFFNISPNPVYNELKITTNLLTEFNYTLADTKGSIIKSGNNRTS